MRFFRCLAGDEVYEQIRLTLDAAWGHPNEATKTLTCVDRAEVAPRDTQGRIMLATNEEFCGYTVAGELLDNVLAVGAIEEIDEATYLQELPQMPLP